MPHDDLGHPPQPTLLAGAEAAAVTARLQSDQSAAALLADEVRLTQFLRAEADHVPGVDWDVQAQNIRQAVAESAERDGLLGGEPLDWQPAVAEEPNRWRIGFAVPLAAAASLILGLAGGYLLFNEEAVPADPGLAVEPPAEVIEPVMPSLQIELPEPPAVAAGVIEVEIGDRPDTAYVEPAPGVVEVPSRVEIEVQ